MNKENFEFISHRDYKFIILVACVLYTVWSPYNTLADAAHIDPLWARFSLSVPLFLITLFSYVNKTIDKYIKYVFYAFVLTTLTHYYYLIYINNLDQNYIMGGVVILCSLMLIIESALFKTFIMCYFLAAALALGIYFEGWDFYNPTTQSSLFLLCTVTLVFMGLLTQFFYARMGSALKKEISENNNLRKWSSLGQMAGGVAHEINSPLTSIYLATDILEEKVLEGKPTEALKQEIDKIKKEAERISSIMKALRLLTKEGTKFSRDTVHLHKICMDTMDTFREAAQNKNISIMFHTYLGQRPIILGNAQSIAQVLSNLFKNAIEVLDDKSEKWIKITLKEDKDNFIIIVQDSGKGIPKEVQDRVFEPFYSTKDIGQGMGIGLSLSRQIAMAHGGNLVVDNSYENTTFKLYIPKPDEYEMSKAS